jgi:hypothetical protein
MMNSQELETTVKDMPPSAGDGGERRPERITAPAFLSMLFAPSDRVAVQTLHRATGRVEPAHG